ncbi:MAG: DUF3972 domain-containing protein [Campylobacterota bacterium]|nr:DUF3972 domain-containing protein [Campylobacterota bacterium]
MERLVKPAEYAKELGISRQAVYAKIKRGILTAKNVEGKLYIILDTPRQEETTVTTSSLTSKPSLNEKPKNSVTKVDTKDYKALLKAKDETISVLKGTVKDLKKSNKQIASTLRSEIDLLKDAFHEMRTLYVHRLEQKKPQETIDVQMEEEVEKEVSVEVCTAEWVNEKKFFKKYNITKPKRQSEILKALQKAYKNGDKRLQKKNGKLKLNLDKKYKDILKGFKRSKS